MQTKKPTKTTKPINTKKTNPFQRGSDKWTYIIYPKDPVTGKAKQKWVGGFATQKEAEVAMHIAQADIKAGAYKACSTMTIEQYLRQWFATYSKAIEPGTAQGYWNNIRLHIVPHIGKTKLCELSRHELTALYAMLQSREALSPATIRYINATLRKALNDAVKDELIRKNPCIGAILPKSSKHKAVTLDKEHARVLMEGVMNSSIETEVLIALTTGARRGEVLGVRFRDVDFAANTIHIVQQVSNVGEGKWGIKCLKTKESNRMVTVPTFVMDSIRERQKVVNIQKTTCPDYQDNDLICCKPDGSIKSPQTVYHQFKLLLCKLGLPDIRFHDLRHTCASLLLEQNVPLAVISKALGHSTINITADIYIDSTHTRHQTAEAMQQLFSLDNT